MVLYCYKILHCIPMIVPKSLRGDMNHLLHLKLLDTAKVKEKGCDTLYWPGINADLENI